MRLRVENIADVVSKLPYRELNFEHGVTVFAVGEGLRPIDTTRRVNLAVNDALRRELGR